MRYILGLAMGILLVPGIISTSAAADPAVTPEIEWPLEAPDRTPNGITVYRQPPQAVEAPQSVLSKDTIRLTRKERTAVSLSKEWKERPVNPVMQQNGKVVYVYGATLPTIVCSPFVASDLELQAGELVNDVIVGDSARWVITAGRSGPVGQESTHLVIKPVDVGLMTTMVVMTDRRTYHLKLVSKPEDYTPYVGFLYPADQQQALQRQLARQDRKKTWQTAEINNREVDLARLDFGYSVKGAAVWRPKQVYNDGRQTVIQFPHTVSQSEMPVLLVEKAGETAIVNYRVRGNSLVIDEVFQKAVLLAGVGIGQEKIEIERQEQ